MPRPRCDACTRTYADRTNEAAAVRRNEDHAWRASQHLAPMRAIAFAIEFGFGANPQTLRGDAFEEGEQPIEVGFLQPAYRNGHARSPLDGCGRGSQSEALLRIVCDVRADCKRRRRGRGGGITHVHDTFGAFEDEVVDHRSVGVHRLCAHA